MATLASLKLVAAKKANKNSPVVHRRNKLSAKIFEQLNLALAHNSGQAYAPTRIKTVVNSEGQRVQVTVPKRIKPWWFISENGKTCLSIRYGAKIIELAKGKTAIEVSSSDGLIEALEAVNEAVQAGELDAQIEAASTQLRDGFQK